MARRGSISRAAASKSTSEDDMRAPGSSSPAVVQRATMGEAPQGAHVPRHRILLVLLLLVPLVAVLGVASRVYAGGLVLHLPGTGWLRPSGVAGAVAGAVGALDDSTQQGVHALLARLAETHTAVAAELVRLQQERAELGILRVSVREEVAAQAEALRKAAASTTDAALARVRAELETATAACTARSDAVRGDAADLVRAVDSSCNDKVAALNASAVTDVALLGYELAALRTAVQGVEGDVARVASAVTVKLHNVNASLALALNRLEGVATTGLAAGLDAVNTSVLAAVAASFSAVEEGLRALATRSEGLEEALRVQDAAGASALASTARELSAAIAAGSLDASTALSVQGAEARAGTLALAEATSEADAALTTALTGLRESLDASLATQDARLTAVEALLQDALSRLLVGQRGDASEGPTPPTVLLRHVWSDGRSVDGLLTPHAGALGSVGRVAYGPDVLALVESAVALLASDGGVALPDYALAGAGASVVEGPGLTSDTWEAAVVGRGEGGVTVHRTPYWALERDTGVGRCWPMAGRTGVLTIRLAARVVITAVTIEHHRGELTLGSRRGGGEQDGSPTSAPRSFSVYGLHSGDVVGLSTRLHLGTFTFDGRGPSTQVFHLCASGGAFPLAQVVVHDNHGHPDFTCLYRVRVHGQVPGEAIPA